MFNKKILVLKQTADGYSSGIKPACGICRLEKENGVLTVSLSLVGFAALTFGEYRLYIVGDDDSVIGRVLGKIPVSCTFSVQNDLDLTAGVSAGIWTVKDDIPLLIAYQKSDDAKLSAKSYGVTVINSIIAERKLREREKEFVIPPAEISAEKPPLEIVDTDGEKGTDFNAVRAEIYNDEAVATENFYDTDKEIRDKLASITETAAGNADAEEDFSSDGISDNFSGGDAEKGAPNGENLPYYLKVKEELDGLFDKFPPETALENAISESRFVKVYYAEEKYYVVGLIRENGKEKYICYGVPSVYRETPPKELAGYCSFVPLSLFDLKGDGYFMMFQDAYSGKCVHKE